MGGGAGISLAVDAHHIPFGNYVMSGKMFEDYPGQRSQVQGIQLHDIPYLFNRVVPGLSDGEGTLSQALPGGYMIRHRLFEHPSRLKLAQYPAYHRD